MKKHLITNFFTFFFLQLFLFIFLFMNDVLAQKELTVASSAVGFKIKNMGFYVNGSFTGLVATIKFDEKNLKESSISATIDAKSINTDNKSRDNHLRKDEYFGVEKYPLIKMETTEIVRSQSGNFIGYFDVTMKDKTKKKVVVPFSYKNNNFVGNLTLNRRDFGVGGSSMVLGDEVTINIEVKTN